MLPALGFRSFGFLFVVVPLVAAPLSGCGGGGDDDGAPNPGADGDVEGGADADTPGGDFVTLIEGDWDLGAGVEGYRCVRKTLTEDTYITGFRSVGPLGTHHTVLTAGDPSGPDGISNCSAGTNAESMIFGSGIGDVEFNFPEGVGVKIPAGQQLVLNLHLFNYRDNALNGTSGTLARFTSADKIQQEAESVLMGPVSLDIPSGGETTETGNCTIETDVTFLTVAPHMHELGRHMRVEAIRDGEATMIHDAPYDFQDQKLYEFEEPLQLSQGDQIRVHCTYDNQTGETVNFGDSSKEEMCFAGMYRYPKRESSFAFACFF